MNKNENKKDDGETTHEKYIKIIQCCTEKRIFFQPNEIYGLEKGFYHFGDKASG